MGVPGPSDVGVPEERGAGALSYPPTRRARMELVYGGTELEYDGTELANGGTELANGGTELAYDSTELGYGAGGPPDDVSIRLG
eukprot:1848767-Rhodomonas_salina.2